MNSTRLGMKLFSDNYTDICETTAIQTQYEILNALNCLIKNSNNIYEKNFNIAHKIKIKMCQHFFF